MKVYVLNDNAGFLVVCRLALEARGHLVETSCDDTMIRADVLRFQPNVIILDWRLQYRTGGQVLQELQTHVSSLPPVLAISSLDSIEVEALRCGAQAFLRKPFTDVALVNAVEALASGRTTP